MDFGLALWGLLTLLAIVGALHLYDQAQAFHQRGLERIRREQVSECSICGYTSNECEIVNNLCSVHTCEVCASEGFACGDDGKILCEVHGAEWFR